MVSIPVATPRDEVRLRPAPLRWTALRYELPASDGSLRARLWRDLRGRQGLNLRHGLWAVPEVPGAPVHLDRVVTRLRAAGAEVDAVPVEPDDGDHHELLVRACEKLWNGFDEAADRLAGLLGAGPSAADHLARGLPDLHRAFRQTRPRDLVQSLAGEGAAQRLDDLEWMEANVRRPGPPVWPEPAVGRQLQLASTVLLADGTMRAVATVEPAPGVAWERAFAAFERDVYSPDPERTEIRHGTVVVTGPTAAVNTGLDAVVTRIGRFEASLP
jgi:hypothetical protein